LKQQIIIIHRNTNQLAGSYFIYSFKLRSTFKPLSHGRLVCPYDVHQ